MPNTEVAEDTTSFGEVGAQIEITTRADEVENGEEADEDEGVDDAEEDGMRVRRWMSSVLAGRRCGVVLRYCV